MLPSQQMGYGLGNAGGALYSAQPNYSQNLNGFYPQQFLSQPFPESSLQGTDPNSPELFKQNMHIAQELLARISENARSALMSIENAYHPGTSLAQTAAYVTVLKQQIQALVTLMRQSGVGALPLLTPAMGVMPPEEQLLADATKGIQFLYEKNKRIQDSAGIVASLLGANEHTRR
ncbi:hypothetical protein GLOTRDRAFT_112444 [Gloeophyllum trabeum ATCC 11539]|uniref:Uncharacterized protein n=1 Tax=Gloeophyllum trabeum (strain ATCC 11539 / FP-39264 / Madison 617) TaxID=670483 RepID=S7PVX9_GLOTA|nr:uncharacterized protein GLOTRDRAFT_112444 [Gloeophyllum trabeum ATCC 11539]EPQ51673.1 hypothetical protein GLOTRDRAFT_112444 [Gloeophyllum trabeum ATCC 11539]